MQILHNLVRMFAFPIGVHHDDAPLPDESPQSIFDPDSRERRVGIAGHNIPENKLKAEGPGHLDRVVIELPIGGTEERRVMTVLGFEQMNWTKNFPFLLVR